MKKLFLTTFLLVAGLAAQAGGNSGGGNHGGNHGGGNHGGNYWGGSHSSRGSSFSFYWGGWYPGYTSWYSYPYAYYPGYAYYPNSAYGYDYGYTRPNYPVSGTLLGAGIGAIIGNNVNHQTWQGAAIGAASGLLLGGLAEHSARVRERASVPAVTYSIPDPPTVNTAPTVPDPPRVQSAVTYRTTSSMSSANSLFGR
jgi:YMGG-like Gly-zipper